QAELNDGSMDKTHFPTDYYYSFHPDPLNSNEKFSLPWLSIGRIPAKKPNDVKNIVEKIIEYEKNPPEDSQFYRRILFSGYFMDTDKERNNPIKNGKACRNYINTLEKLRKASKKVIENTDYVYLKRIYSVEFAAEDVETYLNENKVPKYVKNVMREIEEQSESGESIDSLVTKELKNGPSIVIHRGHGNFNNWDNPLFCSNQFENNSSEAERYPSIFFNINCSTGIFNMEGDLTCMAEDLLKVPKGPPCIVAASATTRTWRNDSLAKALFDGLFGGVLPTFREPDPKYKITDSEPIRNGRVGDILNYAKTYLLVYHQGGMHEGNKEHFEAFHIFGDPSMEIWRKEPGKLELEYKITGNRANKKLKLTLNPKPDEYYISFWSDSKRLEKFPSSLDDILIEDLLSEMENSTSKKEITICCWASGYRFEEKTIELS
ncbi:hypothetical protein KA005_51790, partial [bacterium]|nr:hypothetical protein [bacterium]